VNRRADLTGAQIERLDELAVWNEQGSILPLLLEDLQDSNARVRVLAIKQMSDYTDKIVIERLIDLAQHDPDLDVRCTALSGLGNFIYIGGISAYDPEKDCEIICLDESISREDFERVYDFLLSVWQDVHLSLDEKECAIESLSFFSNHTVETLIAELYARPEKSARCSALTAMGRNGATRWVGTLRSELYSSDPDIQLEAIYAAGEMGLDVLGKDLWRLTYSEDKDTVLAAVWSLGQTGWDGAFDRLDELTLHDDLEIRETADEAMDEWLFYNGLGSDYDDLEDQEPEGQELEDW
jgi:HEAT repeat protein